MATPNDPTTSHGPRDAVIAASIQAVEAGEVPNRQRLGGECPRQELNLVLDLRGVACESVTPPDLSSKAIAKQAKTALLLGAPRVAAQLVDREVFQEWSEPLDHVGEAGVAENETVARLPGLI